MNKKRKIIFISFTIFILFISRFYLPFKNTPISRATVLESEETLSSVPSLSTTSQKEITHGDTSKKQIIFTFDGGGTTESGSAILEALAKHHVTGTFFLTGKMVLAHPDFVKNIALAHHEIFSHTYDHPDLTKLSDEKVSEELTNFSDLLEKTVNISPKPYFRAPYGSRDARVLSIAEKNGYQSVYWTIDALDWKEKQGETAAGVEKRILSTLAPGNIYLMHVGDTITEKILDDVFSEIELRGYKIVSLTQGL